MRAGQLRHKIEIQKKVQVPDGMGGFSEEWVKHVDARAAIWPTSVKEIVRHGKLEQINITPMRIRWRSGIDGENRVLFGSRIFNILGAVNKDERNKQLDLVCEEIT